MNVLVFSERVWPEGGGGELATHLYIKLLAKYGVNVEIAVPLSALSARFGKNWNEQLTIIPVLGYGKYTFMFKSRKLKELIKWADIVYFTGLFNLIPLVESNRKPVVAHIHSYFPLCPIGHMYNFLEKRVCSPCIRNCFKCIWIYESMRASEKKALLSAFMNGLFSNIFLRYVLSANTVIFVSKVQRNIFIKYIEQLYKYKLPKNYVIPNPAPNLVLSSMEKNNVCFLGGVDPIKGFHMLFKAWIMVYRRFKHAKLLTTMTIDLPSIIEKFNIVRLPRLRGHKLNKLYDRCRTVAFPSICPEPSPYVVIESLLRGKLLITSNVGGVPETVDGAPGVKLVPPGNTDALADALDWALSMDRRDAVELGLRNREAVLGRFNSEESVRKLIKVFERVV